MFGENFTVVLSNTISSSILRLIYRLAWCFWSCTFKRKIISASCISILLVAQFYNYSGFVWRYEWAISLLSRCCKYITPNTSCSENQRDHLGEFEMLSRINKASVCCVIIPEYRMWWALLTSHLMLNRRVVCPGFVVLAGGSFYLLGVVVLAVGSLYWIE